MPQFFPVSFYYVFSSAPLGRNTNNEQRRKKKAIDCEKSNLFSALFRHAKNKNTYFWIFYHMSISYLIIE
jgi:hypothetical protein